MASENLLRRLAARQFTPPMKRRNLSPAEEAEIEQAQRKLMPDQFPSEGDPLSDDMSSPFWSGLGGGALGALGGGLGGAALGSAVKTDGGTQSGPGAIAGGGIGALLGYLLAHKLREKKNLDVEETMRRLPRGATQRDRMGEDFFRALVDPSRITAPVKTNW